MVGKCGMLKLVRKNGEPPQTREATITMQDFDQAGIFGHSGVRFLLVFF